MLFCSRILLLYVTRYLCEQRTVLGRSCYNVHIRLWFDRRWFSFYFRNGVKTFCARADEFTKPYRYRYLPRYTLSKLPIYRGGGGKAKTNTNCKHPVSSSRRSLIFILWASRYACWVRAYTSLPSLDILCSKWKKNTRPSLILREQRRVIFCILKIADSGDASRSRKPNTTPRRRFNVAAWLQWIGQGESLSAQTQ